jgi:segregation and condensation protein A
MTDIDDTTPATDDKPCALVHGEAMAQLPEDLYIPPDALEVFLEAFQGPLDLLLYLIKKQNIDVLEIPVASITEQYMEYVNLMKELHLSLAAEYLVMAAMLAEIKSRMLLPRNPHLDEDDEDPRAELIRRLQEYERYKKATEAIDELPRRERDTFSAAAKAPELEKEHPLPTLTMQELLSALREVMKRADLISSHHVAREPLSVRERMTRILDKIQQVDFIPFVQCFDVEEGRSGVVVTFIAILELLKHRMIEVVQAELYSPIHLRAAGGEL